MPDITLTEEQYAELISNTVNTTVAAVSIATQQAVAEKVKAVLASPETPEKKTKNLMVLIGQLENGVMEYD